MARCKSQADSLVQRLLTEVLSLLASIVDPGISVTNGRAREIAGPLGPKFGAFRSNDLLHFHCGRKTLFGILAVHTKTHERFMIDPIPNKKRELAVMFADVAGSTRLFEELGDTAAKKMIDECISAIIELVELNQGEIVKTIGDEVMCRFWAVDNAAIAAVDIQKHFDRIVVTDNVPLKIRIGMHNGSAIIEAGDIFGDVVNVAARMAGIAKAGEIIVTNHFAGNISPHTGIHTRHFDQLRVKGKLEEMIVYSILWEDDSLTSIYSQDLQEFERAEKMTLQYSGIKKQVNSFTRGFTLGRGNDRDLVVNSAFASRAHAVIDYSRGKFILKDQSTNGTYVQDENNNEIYLRREELPLLVTGFISLGAPISSNPDHLIEFISS